MRALVRLGAIIVVGLCVSAVDAAAGGPEADPSPAPTVELHDTIATKTSRDRMAAPLVKGADKAAKAREWTKAIPLYQAIVVAKGAGSPEARQLATLWTLAGQNAHAAEVLAAYAAATEDIAKKRDAEAEVARLEANPDPFAKELAVAVMDVDAKRLFKQGRAAFKARAYADALVYFRMGLALAPDMPGFLRELGATYDKLGAAEQKRAFYRRYLLSRPFGPNADVVRGELGKDKGALGTLEIATSLPCEQLWVNRQHIPDRLPPRGISVAPGTYKGLCFHSKYEMALFEYASVEPGKTARLQFTWGIIVNQLEKPYGRISIENPRAPGVLIDLGISSPEIGVAVPSDKHPLRMVVKDDVGARTEERTIELAPGQRKVVRW